MESTVSGDPQPVAGSNLDTLMSRPVVQMAAPCPESLTATSGQGYSNTPCCSLTGSWRTYRPDWDEEKCVHCLRCWILCPDSSIVVKDGKVTGIDYDHCKGCGICSEECPKDAIEMKR